MVNKVAARPPGNSGDEAMAKPVRLPEVLLASLTALAAAGEVEQACRLAGQACVMLRISDPAASRRFDVLLHRLTRQLNW
ncbi:putative protein OS=Afipia felis OX=1035 GN=BN961_00428 PE=4 SV=1 [Afipia felis]